MKNADAIKAILKIAAKHEVQYWLDEPGTDEEKLRRIVGICREAIDFGKDGRATKQPIKKGSVLAVAAKALDK